MNLKVGKLPKGMRNSISDVAGVTVGHCTVDTETHKTGVTVVVPCQDDMFRRKLVAACHVLNGFGKTLGLVQIEELGTLETPIALTNTLNVGLVHDAVVEYMLRQADAGGYELRSVNPVVCECNDSSLNDIRRRVVGQREVFSALESASAVFAEGDVGAGKGMTCHGLKGGIGSSSRLVEIGGETFTVGVLALTNHGSLSDLTVSGENIGAAIEENLHADAPDKGSCILILATDLPVSSRQLGRIIRRMASGLARVGSRFGHGSGDIMIGFSTANRIPDDAEIMNFRCIHEDRIDAAFRAASEASEEAVLRSLFNARTVTGYRGKTRKCLREVWPGR